MTIYSASPAKLRSGEWGARIDRPLVEGSEVDLKITTKAGKSWNAVGVVIWSDRNKEVSLLRTVKRNSKPAPRRSSSHRVECGECGEWFTTGSRARCWETGGTHSEW